MMSILLALLRSARTPGSFRNRQTIESNYTELGVFKRHSCEGRELQPYSPDHVSTQCQAARVQDCVAPAALQLQFSDTKQNDAPNDTTAELVFVLAFLESNPTEDVPTTEEEALRNWCWSGEVLCQLLSDALPGSLDERAVNKRDVCGELTDCDVLENFQMCHSCAQAQGCDVQGLAIARLLECEASTLVDFVLEVLRCSVAQALPARHRCWMSGPPPEALRPPDPTVTNPITRGWARTTQNQLATAPAPYRTMRLAVNGDSTSAGSALEGGAAAVVSELGPNGGTESSRSRGHRGVDNVPVADARGSQPTSSGAGTARGTAAARRAATSLEYWALQLVGAAAGNGATQAPGGATGAGTKQQLGTAAAGPSSATGAVASTAGDAGSGAVPPALTGAASSRASVFSAATAAAVAAAMPAGIVSGSGSAPVADQAGGAGSSAGRPSAESALLSGADPEASPASASTRSLSAAPLVCTTATQIGAGGGGDGSSGKPTPGAESWGGTATAAAVSGLTTARSSTIIGLGPLASDDGDGQRQVVTASGGQLPGVAPATSPAGTAPAAPASAAESRSQGEHPGTPAAAQPCSQSKGPVPLAVAQPRAHVPAVSAAAHHSARSKGPTAPAAAQSRTRGKNAAAGGGCISTAEGARLDHLSLEAWEALAALLLLRGASQHNHPEHFAAKQLLLTREQEVAVGASGSRRECAPGEGAGSAEEGAPSDPGFQGVDGAGAAGRLPVLMDDVSVGDGGCDSGCDARWAAVAEALSQALSRSCTVSGSSSSNSNSGSRPPRVRAGAGAGKVPPPPPPLKPEHLRCTHPGLRSVLLAYALLALSRGEDVGGGAASSPAVDTAAAAAAAIAGGSSGRPCRSDGGSSVGSSSTSGFGADEFHEAQQLPAGGGPYGSAGDSGGGDSPCCSGQAATAAAAAAGASAVKPPPASPAPPLPHHWQARPSTPPLRSTRSAGGGGGSGGPPATESDTLSEHNKLVQREHEERERRRRQQQQQEGGKGTPRPTVTMGEAGLGGGMLWTGDGDDAEGEDQEERVLRLWLNSLDPRIQVSSLFEREVATGWPLLQALDAIQPGCVSWADTFRPPFKEKLHKILSVQNCNQVVEVCTRQLAMPPLVNIGGLDLALGHRRATLSLVFQIMRHHMGMLLGLVTPPSKQPQQQQQPPSPRLPPSPLTPVPSSLPSLSSGTGQGGCALPSPGPGAAPATGLRTGLGSGPSSGSGGGSTAAASPAGASGSEHGTNTHGYGHSHSHSLGHGYSQGTLGQPRGHRPHVEVEKAVLAWANAKLTAAAAAAASCGSNGNPQHGSKGPDDSSAAPAAAAPAGPGFRNPLAPDPDFAPLSSFSDPRLGQGRVLLQLLAAVCPRTVNPKYVLPGRSEEERSSNARYLLSCARKIGCIIFLGWEDVVAARPKLLLPLIASFMALDRKRAGAAAAAAAAAPAVPSSAPRVFQAAAGDVAGEHKRSETAPASSAGLVVTEAPAGSGAPAGGGDGTAASG